MTQELDTCLYWRYEVSSPTDCTVTDSRGNILGTARPGTPLHFTADGHPVTLSADSATMLPTRGQVAGGGGGSALPASGEPVRNLESDALLMTHATWFENTAQRSLTISPAEWKNEVITCYLKSAVPVELTGVTWIYGTPAMIEGYTYVIALQQIDAATVLANLAYSLPQ